jgi:hypothetical protein
MRSARFRFDAATHTYSDQRGVIPHITGLLTVSGWTDERWFTEEGSQRGQAVHLLTAEYDLGALAVEDCVSPFRGYLLAHVACCQIVKPAWRHIETPAASKRYRLAGRCDRVAVVYRAGSVWEIKSGAPDKAHPIQTALQAILCEEELRLPAEAVHRYACYLREDGRYKLERHKDRRDFAEAHRIIRAYC